jgi:hypothetical protein
MTELIDIERHSSKHLKNVTFLDLNTNESARFAVPGDVTLQRAWDMAYDELGETRRPADVLESRSGTSLAPHLGESIEHIKKHVVHDLRFQIHGEQGGA